MAANKTLEKIADLYDKHLLDMLENGKPAVDQCGNPVLDKDGKPVRVPLSASDLQAIRGRLRDCGVTAVPGMGGTIDKMAEGAEKASINLADWRKNMGLPPIEQAGDDVATA